MKLKSIVRFTLTLLVTISVVNGDSDKNKKKSSEKVDLKKEERANAKLPPCGACGNLVASFEKGMERTNRGKLEGGDAAWEEQNQAKGYATSEVRFVEVQEKLCHEVDRGEHQCHSNHHEWEEMLETWWKMDPNTRPALKQWLCVEQLKVCCSENTFGPQCKECPMVGKNGKICSGNGKCKGAGTRKGNGQCACDKGYTGGTCYTCDVNYFVAYQDDDKLLCNECHNSCQGHCTGSGPKACMACKPGYSMDTEEGCMDLDECNPIAPGSDPSGPIKDGTKQASVCPKDKFCVNTEGSFTCLACDRACRSCHGDGPDSCIECAEGYSMNKDNFCISDETAEDTDRHTDSIDVHEQQPNEEL